MTAKLSAFACLALGAAGCSNSSGDSSPAPPPVDGPVTLLTSDNLNGDDDDPTIAVDPQGNLHVVWFSDRDGTKDLYEIHSTAFDLSTATIAWSPPIQITHNDPASFPPPTQGDNFPSLLIDAAGTHHLAWHRWNLANESHILYARSDGTAAGWAAATVVNVTSGANFDRFPNVARFASNDLRIYFGSSTRVTSGKNDILVAKSIDDGVSWGAPAAVPSLSVAGEQSSFPTIRKLATGSFLGTLQRWKLEPSSDALDPAADVFYATSSDSETWTVFQVTSDPGDVVNDFVPSLFLDHIGDPRVAWASIGFGDPAGDIVQMRVSDETFYPNFVMTLSSAVGVPDHSPQIVPLTIDGQKIFVMVWVRIDPAPHNQVVYRMFSEL